MENEINNNNFVGNTFDISINGSLILNTLIVIIGTKTP